MQSEPGYGFGDQAPSRNPVEWIEGNLCTNIYAKSN